MVKHKIAVVCWCTSPLRGSEFAVSWNYIQQMSKTNKLFVFYGTSGGGIGNVSEVTKWASEHEHDNIEFIDIKLPKNLFTMLLNKWRKYSYIYPFYFQYKIWHRQVRKVVESYYKNGEVDLIHYLNPIGFKEPGQVRKIKAPYIWGPVQTVQNRPLKLWKVIWMGGAFAVLDCLVRLIVHNAVLLFNANVWMGVRRSDVLFAATPLSQIHFNKIFHKESIYLPENGIVTMERNKPIEWDGISKLELIWVGGLCYRKGLGLLIDALALLTKQNAEKVHLNVVGTGELRNKMELMAHNANISVTFWGSIDRSDVQRIFMKSHLHIITSIGDATTTVLWEAMSKAIPTLTLDHCGMAGVVCNKCGIKIPISNYKKTAEDISAKICTIIESPSIIKELSTGCLECAKQFDWENRIKVFNKAYDDAIIHYENKHK